MKKHIIDGLGAYLNDNNIPWHMPGHKRKDFQFNEGSANIEAVLGDISKIDVTEVYGLDDLHLPEGMINDSQEEITHLYGSYKSYYLVNGATSGILTAIFACTNPGDKILVARNCHKSVYNAVELRGLNAVYLSVEEYDINGEVNRDSEIADTTSIYGQLKVDEVSEAILNNSDARALVLTSPTYEGIVSDIAAISELTKKHNIRLIVDEAHGAHLPFAADKLMCESSIGLGADIVVQSLHKTLPAMTQTAVLHVNLRELDYAVKKYKSIFMTSSPSYVMLASMEKAIGWASDFCYEEYVNRLTEFRKKAENFKNILLFKPAKLKDRFYDISRLVFTSKVYGSVLEKELRERFNIICEMSGAHHIVLISTPFDSRKDFDYLYEALFKLDRLFETDRDFTFDEQNKVIDKIEALEGSVAEDNIYVYPPGSYIVVKGESVTKKQIDLLVGYAKSNKVIRGI